MTECDTRQPSLVHTSWHHSLFTEFHKKTHKASNLPLKLPGFLTGLFFLTQCSEFDLKNPPFPTIWSGLFLHPGLAPGMPNSSPLCLTEMY